MEIFDVATSSQWRRHWPRRGRTGVDNAVLTPRRHCSEVRSLALLPGEAFLTRQQFLRQASQLPGLFIAAAQAARETTKGLTATTTPINGSSNFREPVS